MENRDLERICFVTRHFNDLQGLKIWIPLGLITLGLQGPMLLRAGLIGGALLLMLGARWYYRNTFGEVQRPPVDDAVGLSVFSPAGPAPRLEGVQQVTPILLHFVATLAVAATVFIYFQALPPNFLVQGDESLGQHPRVFTEVSPYYGPLWVSEWAYPKDASMRPPSMVRAVAAQTMYLLYGSLLLGVWLWRGRRGSQGHHLALAALLLGLSGLGTSLGFLARKSGEIPRLLDLCLPALVYPGLALLLCGSAMILVGLIDHLQLVDALGRPAAWREEG
jgi:hypothetical protein